MTDEQKDQMWTTVPLRIPFILKLDEETNTWTAINEQLDICTQGKTEWKAMVSFNEAALLWFKSCIERGTLKEAITG